MTASTATLPPHLSNPPPHCFSMPQCVALPRENPAGFLLFPIATGGHHCWPSSSHGGSLSHSSHRHSLLIPGSVSGALCFLSCSSTPGTSPSSIAARRRLPPPRHPAATVSLPGHGSLQHDPRAPLVLTAPLLRHHRPPLVAGERATAGAQGVRARTPWRAPALSQNSS